MFYWLMFFSISFVLKFDFLTVLKEGRSRNKCYFYHRNTIGNDRATCEDKTDSAKDCHDLCYKAEECAQFVWFDKTFEDGQRFKDCCLKTIHVNDYVYAKGAISGEKYCDDLQGENIVWMYITDVIAENDRSF